MKKLLTAFTICTIALAGVRANSVHRQWRISEFSFQAEDVPEGQPRGVEFGAKFTGPDGENFNVPGFWDGGKTWRLRFTPTAPGIWNYRTASKEKAMPVSTCLFETDVMRGGDAPQRIDIPVNANSSSLRLVVTDGGDNTSYDHADWADAALVDADGKVIYLETLKPLSSKQGHGTLGLGKNLQGNPLKIGERTFKHGLGSHSTGEIVYALDKRWVRFRAWVGIDAQIKDHGTVRFKVFAERPAKEREGKTDPGLHNKSGTFAVLPAEGKNPFQRHGGILRVSNDRHYLTYADGTPFFWLGDTSWFTPSDLMPLDSTTYPPIASPFRALIEKRREQHFTVLHMAFLGRINGHNPFSDPERSPDLDPAYWQQVDRYINLANENGIMPAIGMGWRGSPLTPDKWRVLWRHMIARYGAHAVTWLICGEYNVRNTSDEQIAETMQLGQFIKDTDPYKRAMTIHPWAAGAEKCQVWDESWYDFIMIQGGHGPKPPSPKLYLDAYARQPPRPVLESECKYEGIHKHLAPDVREVAYRAIQCGSFGYTYGSHGLWYPTQNEDDPRHDQWGKRTPWWKALERPGATQLGHMRTIYESVPWWQLVPLTNAVVSVIDNPINTGVKKIYSLVEHFPEAKALNEHWSRLFKEQQSISLHPKSKGDAVLTFPPITLPEAGPDHSIRLVLAFGMSPQADLKDKKNPFDGVTMGVRINGKMRLSEKITEKPWRYHQIDITEEAGKTVSIELTSNAGGNGCWDHCLFRQPVVVRTTTEDKRPLEKQYTSAPSSPVFAKSIGKDLFFLYYSAGNRICSRELRGVRKDTTYAVVWRNPRTGGKTVEQKIQTTDRGTCILPKPPDEKDWVLILNF